MKMKYCAGTFTGVLASVVLSAFTVYAAGWEQNGPGWKYLNEDGSYINNGWNWIDGNGDGESECYYFTPTGYLLTDGTTPDGYKVNKDGAWTVDGEVQVKKLEISDEDIAEWFKGTVMVGDSIMQGFENYCMLHSDTWLSSLQFFCRVSYSLYNDVHGAIRPLYRGQPMRMADALPLMGAKRVFFMFGANDINTTGVTGTQNYYKNAIDGIKASLPDIDANIISMTYVTDTYTEKGSSLGPATITQYNSLLAQNCAANGWGYVDLANSLSDGAGHLPHAYAAKDGIHQGNAAYAVWAQVLHDYAVERIKEERGINKTNE